MDSRMLPGPFRNMEGSALKGPVPHCFELFYRAHLRFRSGGRIRSPALASRYAAWAEREQQPALHYKALRRAMENVGHRRRRSNGIYYADAVFADAAPDLPDTFPATPPLPASDAASLVQQIDRIACELNTVRAIAARLTDEGRMHRG